MRKVMLLVAALGCGYAKEAVTSEGDFRVSVGGKLLFDTYSGKNKEENGYRFTGDFLRDLLPNGVKLPTHSENFMVGLNRSKFTVTADRVLGDVRYAFKLVFSGDSSSTRSVREIYVQIENPRIGAVSVGNTRGVEDLMVSCPSDFVVGSGGTDGTFSKFVNNTTDCTITPTIKGDTRESTKIVLLSPRKGGLQLGVSYAPNNHHYGEAPMNLAYAPDKKPFMPFDIKSWALGVNYMAQWSTGSLSLSCVHLRGTTRGGEGRLRLDHLDTKAWDMGCVLTLGPWVLGAEYILNGTSHRLKNNVNNITPVLEGIAFPSKNYIANTAGKSTILNTGLGYVNKTGGITFSYLHSNRRTGIVSSGMGRSSKATGNVYAISTEYYLAPGFSPYVEGVVCRMKNPDWAYMGTMVSGLTGMDFIAVPSNKARMVLAGLKVQF